VNGFIESWYSNSFHTRQVKYSVQGLYKTSVYWNQVTG